MYLAFRYKGAVNTVVTAIAKDDKFYLPVTELFSLLQVDYSLNIQNMAISGYYLDPNRQYRLGFRGPSAQINEQEVEISADDVMLTEIDFYMLPAIYEKMFGLKFSIDVYHLSLELESAETLPVVAQIQRSQQRQQQYGASTIFQEDYPLLYPRQPSMLDGGFMDYSAFSRFGSNGSIMNYNLQMGGEVLTGDLQGTFSGAHTSVGNAYSLSGVRWRYVMRDRPEFSTLEIGQVRTAGLLNSSVAGVHVTNEPIEPRRLFDNYIIDGTTIPQSEVELYRNNQLIAFEKADDQGYYRFSVPLTYGSADLSLKIYNPSGGVTELDRRVQVPFTYIPPGEVYYNVSGGKQQARYLAWNDRRTAFHAGAAYGINNQFTGKLGIDYEENTNADQPVLYSSLVTRVGLQYLLNFDVAPGLYYRLQANAQYPSSAGWRVDYTKYDGTSVLNRTGRLHGVDASFYYPLKVKSQQLLTQFTGRYQVYPSDHRLNYRVLISSTYQRIRLRLAYRGIYSNSIGNLGGVMTPTITYTVPRARDIPEFFRGMYFRTELQYGVQQSRFEQIDVQFLKSLSKKARYRLTFSRNILSKFNSMEFTLSYDFDLTRSTSSLRINRGEPVVTQTFRGSVGYDSHYKSFIPQNRQQVGRSGASVRMFVDSNDSGTLDSGEEQISGDAIRVRNATGRITESDSVARLTHLQAYRRYNLEVNEAKITNPVWVPKVKEFSIITDPNRYKQIDIPFYITGIIDGQVLRQVGEQVQPVAGLRVMLTGQDKAFTKTMRTFSDGSFYAMEVPPGKYTLQVDSTQLQFLRAQSNPAKRTITVNAVPQGDFVEGLNFTLTPYTPQEGEQEQCRYFVRAGLFRNWETVLQEKYIAESLYQEQFRILYNPENEQYELVSTLFQKRRRVENLLTELHDRQVEDAVVSEDCPPYQVAIQYRVQLGMFASENRAEVFADSVQSVSETPVTVKTYSNDTQYHVLRESFTDWKSAFLVVDSLKQAASALRANILAESPYIPLRQNNNFSVYVGVFETRDRAANVRDRIREQMDISLEIVRIGRQEFFTLRSQGFTDLKAPLDIKDTLHRFEMYNPEVLPAGD